MKTINQSIPGRIIIVAYRLPFKLAIKKGKSHITQNSGGLVSAVLSLAEKINTGGIGSSKIIWVGTGEEQLGNQEIKSGIELYPVEIPGKMNEKYYGGFCNETIWPLFHYFPTRTVFDNSYFEAYTAANELFFNKLQSIIQPGDLIWIHDYQLFLLPEMLRNSFPKASIGFFLHIPFPSFELFRLLPKKWRESLLTGIIGADIIGFHTNDYTQHFIKSVRRTLGYKVERNFIMIKDRLSKADSFPIGIDYDKFHNACFLEKTRNCINKLDSQINGKKLVFSIDRLDYSKGFLTRLAAYERFLEKYHEWHFKVVFNMIVIPSRDNIEGYKKIKKEIESVVGRINGKYSTLSWRPVIYQYKSVPFNELVAIYNFSDVGFITPLRDGMNLVAKEFVACQDKNYGMLLLSEMAGAASELSEAVLINPTDIEEVSDAINNALIMPEEEKEKRVKKMQIRLARYNVFTWTSDFFTQLSDVKKEQEKLTAVRLDNSIMDSLRGKYHLSDNRLFFFDYDGTLTPLIKNPEEAALSEKTKKILKNIVSDTTNIVVIISGRDKAFMEEQFKDLNAILVAEHGYFIKYPEEEWETTINVDLSWKENITSLLNDYVDRCSGSLIEDKHSSVAWHYRNAEDEIISLRINELKDDLYEALHNEEKLQILEGDKVIEVKSALYDKGTIAASLIRKENYDFIVAIGDDRTDEDLFKAIPENGFAIKVGAKPTNARYNVRNQEQVIEILSLFTT